MVPLHLYSGSHVPEGPNVPKPDTVRVNSAGFNADDPWNTSHLAQPGNGSGCNNNPTSGGDEEANLLGAAPSSSSGAIPCSDNAGLVQNGRAASGQRL
jgi:hypothetical protein